MAENVIADNMKTLLNNQYQAALCTLGRCAAACSEEEWTQPVANLDFCQVLFHTLFYADYYLGQADSIDELKSQAFHVEHEASFRDYEEIQDRKQVLHYDRKFIESYLDHCRRKATRQIAEETEGSLGGPSGFARRNFSRGELHVYNIRHIQHHAAQLGLHLRLKCGAEVPWIGSGWED